MLDENNIPTMSGVDTRMLTRILRDANGLRAIITDISTPTEEAVAKIKATERPTNLVSKVSCKKRWFARTANYKYDIVAIDCGMKYNMVRSLNAHNCNVTVVPWNTSAEQIMSFKPDGVLISNGPGSPEDVPEVVETIRQAPRQSAYVRHLSRTSAIALAYGAKIGAISPGHRGGNHPVKEPCHR